MFCFRSTQRTRFYWQNMRQRYSILQQPWRGYCRYLSNFKKKKKKDPQFGGLCALIKFEILSSFRSISLLDHTWSLPVAFGTLLLAGQQNISQLLHSSHRPARHPHALGSWLVTKLSGRRLVIFGLLWASSSLKLKESICILWKLATTGSWLPWLHVNTYSWQIRLALC